MYVLFYTINSLMFFQTAYIKWNLSRKILNKRQIVDALIALSVPDDACDMRAIENNCFRTTESGQLERTSSVFPWLPGMEGGLLEVHIAWLAWVRLSVPTWNGRGNLRGSHCLALLGETICAYLEWKGGLLEVHIACLAWVRFECIQKLSFTSMLNHRPEALGIPLVAIASKCRNVVRLGTRHLINSSLTAGNFHSRNDYVLH